MNQKKKILYVIDLLSVGGAERVFVDLAILMEHAVHADVCLIIGGGPLLKDLPLNMSVFTLNRKNKYSIKSAYKGFLLFRKYDFLHVHMRHNFRYVAIIKFLFRLKSKIILHDHFGSIERDGRMVRSWTVNWDEKPGLLWFILKPDFYIGVCQKLESWAVNKWLIKPSKCNVLVNLPSKFAEFQNHSQFQRVNRQGIVILGNIKPVKNQKFGMELAGILNKKLTLIGQNQDEKYFGELMEVPRDFEFDIVCDVTNPNLVLGNFEIGLCPSLSESGPLVVLDYLRAGIPFLAYITGGIGEVASVYFPEYFIDNHRVDDWLEKIRMILTNYAVVDEVKLREMFVDHFSEEAYCTKLLEIYEKET